MREPVAVLERDLELFQNHADLVALGRQFGGLALSLSRHPADWLAASQTSTYPRLFNAEAIPEIAAQRATARETAFAIYEKRMQHLRDGEYDSVPQAVDPLSTAARVVEAEGRYGKQSSEYKTWYSSLEVDSSRLLAEAGSKRGFAYFPMLEQQYDRAGDGYAFKGRILLDMVSDGITPITETEENDYRIGEYVEEAISPVVRTLGKTAMGEIVVLPLAETDLQPVIPAPRTASPPQHEHSGQSAESDTIPAVFDKSVHTIAEVADWALELYDQVKDDPAALAKADFQGYVPPIKKFMIRTFRYHDRTGRRYLEQAAVPGTWITSDVILEFKYRTGVLERGQTPDKVARRGTQMIDFDGRGALDILRMLDDIASEFSGKNIYKGEEVPASHPKDYAAIPHEALALQQKFETDKKVLTDHLIELEKKGTDHFLANALVANFVQDLLLEKVKTDPEHAEIIFDKHTADGIRKVMAHQDSGNETAAADLWQRIKAEAPKVEFCTGGSCDLAAVSPSSAEGLKARDLLGDGEIVRDTKRACPKCQEYEVYYDVQTGSKACLNCRETEIKK